MIKSFVIQGEPKEGNEKGVLSFLDSPKLTVEYSEKDKTYEATLQGSVDMQCLLKMVIKANRLVNDYTTDFDLHEIDGLY